MESGNEPLNFERLDAVRGEAAQGDLRALDEFVDVDAEDRVRRRAYITCDCVEVDQQALVGSGGARRLGKIGECGEARPRLAERLDEQIPHMPTMADPTNRRCTVTFALWMRRCLVRLCAVF